MVTGNKAAKISAYFSVNINTNTKDICDNLTPAWIDWPGTSIHYYCKSVIRITSIY